MTSSLRILYVLPYSPSPIRVRPYQIIRALAKQGHRLTVVALEDGNLTEAARRELNEVCEIVHSIPHSRLLAVLNCLKYLPTPVPLWGAYCRSPRMERLLQELATPERFDVVHVEHLRAAHFAGALAALPRVLDAVDCITDLRRQILEQGGGLKRMLEWEEWQKMRRYEPRIYRPFHQIAVTSRHDASALISLEPERLPPIEVIPNGVDIDYFCPLLDVPAESDTLVFSGKMSYIANEDAARFLLMDILPLVRKKRPETRVILAGSQPSTALRELAGRVGNVTVTGFVDDLRPYLSRGMVAVCPMRIGVGIQNKALEAMAMGRPVVASPLAGRALQSATETGALVLAETASEFAERCLELLDNPGLAKRGGEAARRYVEETHRWSGAAERFCLLYERAIAERRDRIVR